MKGLFCYDGPLKKDTSGNYYGIALNNDIFSRYFKIASNLTLAVNTKVFKEKEDLDKYSKIDLDRLIVTSLPSLSSLKGMILNKSKVDRLLINEFKKADFVIVRLPSFIGISAVKLAKKYKKPLLIELVGCPLDAFWNHSLKGKFIAPLMYHQTKKIIREATHVVYVTNKFLQKRYPTNGQSVNCSNVTLTDFNSFVLDARHKKIDKMKSKGKIVLGTIGATSIKYKGQQDVIKALGKLKKQGNAVFEYHLVGSGDNSYLRKQADKYDVSDLVKFKGPIPHNKIYEWLDSIDIYIQPSKTEGLPRALIEAMSRGCPAIGSDAGGIPELLESEVLYKNSWNNHGEICEILNQFNECFMHSKASRNYLEAKSYRKEIIENRRLEFFLLFRDSIR